MQVTTSLPGLLESLTSTLPVEIATGIILGGGAALWGWWRWGPSKRRELTTPDRLDYSLKLGATARQLDMLNLYDQQLLESGDVEHLWPRIQGCLDNLLEIGFGPAAKNATGNAGSGFSKDEGAVAMLMVGTISNLATGYAQQLKLRIIEDTTVTTRVRPDRMGLSDWAELYRFAEKVFDPTQRTPRGISRLERRLRRRLIDMKNSMDAEEQAA